MMCSYESFSPWALGQLGDRRSAKIHTVASAHGSNDIVCSKVMTITAKSRKSCESMQGHQKKVRSLMHHLFSERPWPSVCHPEVVLGGRGPTVRVSLLTVHMYSAVPGSHLLMIGIDRLQLRWGCRYSGLAREISCWGWKG